MIAMGPTAGGNEPPSGGDSDVGLEFGPRSALLRTGLLFKFCFILKFNILWFRLRFLRWLVYIFYLRKVNGEVSLLKNHVYENTFSGPKGDQVDV